MRWAAAVVALTMSALEVQAQGGEQPHHLLPAHLAGPPDSLQRGPREVPLGDQVAPRPGAGVDVHVLVLECYGLDQLATACQDAGRLGSAESLAARERNEIGAVGDERPQVGLRRERRRCVDEDGHAVPTRH